MADARSALLAHLTAADDTSQAALRSAIDDVDLAEARRLAADDPSSAEAVASVLGRMLVDGLPVADLADAAKAAAQRAPRDEGGNAVALLCGAVLWRSAKQPQVAEPYFRRVRRSDPANAEVLAFYREIFADDAAASQLLQVLVQARRASGDAEQRLALAEEMATLAESRLGSADRAIEVWRSVMREDGYTVRAASALQRLYRDGGKWTALVDLLKDELERLPAGSDHDGARIEKLLEVAELYRDRLKLDTMALGTLQRILDLDPRHEASLQALADTYEKAGRYNDLLGVYQRRIDAAASTGDVERQVELLRKIAEIWMEKLGNPQRALEPLARVRELRPDDGAARDLLARIHEKRRDWRALINLRREELQGKVGDEALQLRLELARLAEQRLGDRSEAIAAYNEVIDVHGDVHEAIDPLVHLYERESRWASAAELLHRKLAHADRDDAIALLGQLGALYTDRLHARADAVCVWSELLRLVPGHDKAIRRLRDAHVAENRWDELVQLYRGQGRVSDVVDVLQSAADRVGDTQARVALYRRVASLCADELGQPERAQKALERTLAIQPDNLDVARQLVPIYREQSNWARMMSTYEVLLRAAEDDDERLSIIESLQHVAEHELASPTLTLSWAAAAYRLRPDDESRRSALETAAERADGWDELVAIFEARIAHESVSDAERLALLDKLAVIARDRLFKPDDAQRYFRRIIAVDPTDARAMTALEEIYTSMRRWEDLSEVYRRRLEVTEDEAARLDTLRALARLQESQLGDLDQATTCLREILELQPDDDGTLDALARIQRNRGNWADLAEVLERKLHRVSKGSARVPLVFELAQLRALRLAQSDEAVAGFLAVLELEPMHRGAVEALEGLRQADPSTSLPVMRGLLPFYQRVQDREKEAEAMEVIVAAEDDPAARRRQLALLADSYEAMPERREDALRIRGELFAAEPESWEGRQTLLRLGTELQRLDDVSTAYGVARRQLEAELEEARAGGHTMPRERMALRRDLLLEHGAMLRDLLGRPAEAEAAYREILDQDETHQGAYEALESLLRERSANEELVQLYRRRVDVTFNQREQRELLSRMIDISRTLLGDRATAIATAEELLDLIPDDLATIQLLAQMYAEGQEARDHGNLEEILGRWAELVDDDVERRRLMVWRGRLRMEQLGDAFGAVDLFGQVLGDDPDDEPSRQLLEHLLEEPSVQLQACALLEPIYERRADHSGRIRVLQVRGRHAQQSGSVDEAVTLLIAIARIYEHQQGDAATAFEAMRQAYVMDPRRLDTREDVERLGLAQGRATDLVAVWNEALETDVASDPALRIDLTHRVCVLLDEQLRDQEGARQAYSALLALDPPDASLAHKAVEALCRLHLEAGDGVALVEAKRQLLRFTDGRPQQVRIRLEIAAIQEQLGDRIGAAMSYSEVLDMQPDALGALEALERLFLEEEEWERLCEVLEHRIEVTADPRSRAPVWRQVGEIQRDQLGDIHRALSAFQSVLDLKVGREETSFALSAIVELNERLERWADVEDGLRRLVSLSESESERIDLLLRTATVVGKHLGRGPDALVLLKRVLDLTPRDPRAREAVAAYLEHDDTWDQALKILMPLFEEEQNWPALLELEELQARRQPSGRRRLQALLRVAKTQEERLGDPGSAFGVLCDAMAEAADQPELAEILEKVERLGATEDRAEAVFDAYGATVDHILDADLQQRVLRAMGLVALERLGRLDGARRAYERVLELSPADDTATDALERIYHEQGDAEALARLLLSRADRAAAGPARDDLLIRAAELHRVHLQQAEAAISLYERLSAEALERPDVQQVLEPLLEETGRFVQLAAQLNRKLAQQQGRDAVQTHLRLGHLYGEKLDDPEEGMRHLGLALRLDPDHSVGTDELARYLEDPSMRIRAAQMLEPVFAAVGDWDKLIQIQEIRLQQADSESDRVTILLRIAQIEEEQLEDLDKAFDSYTRVFREQPGNRIVRDQLARLAGVLSQLPRYAELLGDFVNNEGAADDSDEMLAIVREAADLWAGSLRKPDRAVPLLQRIRNARPDHDEIFPALESALTQAEMWSDLLVAYWNEIEVALDEDRQLELLRRAATLSQELLENLDEAGRAYQRMLELRPDGELARTRLEQIYETMERWPELVDLLRDRAARTIGPEAQNWVWARIADVQEGRLEDADGALDTLETMLSQLPDDPEAVLRLERIAEMRRSLRPRTLEILRPIYERQGNVRRLVEVDEWKLNHTEEPAERHALYQEMADLMQRTGEHNEAAFRTLCRAVAEPGPAQALERLDAEVARIADVLELRPALAEALVTAADAEPLASETERRLQLYVWAGRLRQELGDPATSADVLERALELHAEDEGALALLDAAYVALGEHAKLEQTLVTRATVATDDAARVDLLRRRATLLEDVLSRDEDAEPVWKDLLDLEPSDREALERLAARYQRSGAGPELADVLERRIESSTDPGERRELRLQLASLHREALRDRGAEIDTLRALLAEVEGDPLALARLSAALVAEERHGEAVDVLVERVALADGVGEKADLLLEAARLVAGPLGDPMGALERYGEVLSLNGEHDEALGDLVRMATSSDHFDAAGMLVRPFLEAARRWEALDRVLAARAQLSADPDARGEAMRRLADLRLHERGDVQGAQEALDALAAAAEPGHLAAILPEAGRLAVQLGAAAEYAERLAERASEIDRDPIARLRTAGYAAELCEEIVGDPDRALAILLGALQGGIADAALCDRIERLGRSRGDLAAVQAALREHARLCDDPAEQASVLVRLGHTERELGQPAAALDAFRDAFEGAPDRAAVEGLSSLLPEGGEVPVPGLLDALDAAYLALGDKAGQASVVSHRLAHAGELEQPRLYEQLAILCDEGGGTPEDALEAWGRLLALDADSSMALDRLLSLSREHGQLPRAAELLLEAIDAAADAGRDHTVLSLRVAALLLRDLSEASAATAVVERVLADQPDHGEALSLLVEAARSGGDPEALHAALVRAAGVQPDPERATRLWSEAAATAEGPLGDPARAIIALDEVIANDEQNGGAWSRLIALLSSAGDHERLADALSRRASITEDPEERHTLRSRLAEVYDAHLGRPEDAVATYQDMVTDHPEDLSTLGAMEKVLRRLERWEDVRDALERRAEVGDAAARVEALRALARLAEERLDDAADAIERLQQLRLEAPGDAAAEADLERLLSAEERWVDLSELLDARMQRQREAADADGHRATASALADLLAGELGDVERAAGILGELLEMDPSYVPAMLAMAKVHEARGDMDAMREALDRAAALHPQGDEGAQLHLRLAELSEADAARREHLETALSLSPGHAAALRALLALCREAGDWARVSSLLERRADAEPDPERQRALVLERVDIMLERLGDNDGALGVLAGLYEQVQDDVEINRRIADALFETGRHEEAVGMYAWLVEVGRQNNRRAKTLAHDLTRMARISMGAQDKDGAREKLLESYRIDTTNVETLIALGDLHEHSSEWTEALKIYRTMLLQNADRTGLLRRGDIYVHLARAHIALEETPKARAMLRRGLEEDSSHQELQQELAALGD